MDNFVINNQQKIISTLREKMPILHCPMCGNNDFSIVDGLVAFPIQENLNNFILGGRNIPALALVCTKCGYISYHSILVLKLLESSVEKPLVENKKEG